jgi:putative ABC transport system permease protein
MRFLLLLAARSAWNRRLTLGMTLIAVALSVTLLLAVERVRLEAPKQLSHNRCRGPTLSSAPAAARCN